MTGKLGSLGQPVLRSKAKEMELQFAATYLRRPSPRRRQPRRDERAGARFRRDRRAGHRLRRRRHVCGDRSGAPRRAGAAGRPQPDRPRRRHGHGADDGRGRARRRDAGRSAAIISPTRSPPAAGCATRRWRSCSARMRRTASASWMPGVSAGRARTATSPRPRRRATTGRAASMSISSIPGPRCRRRCARVMARNPRSAKPAISASSISSSSDGDVTGAVAYHLAPARRS